MNELRFPLIILLLLIFIGCASHESEELYLSERYEEYYHLDFENCQFSKGLTTLGIWTWSIEVEQPRATVMLLHGYLDHSALNRDLIQFLVENDFNIIAWDLPGHGLSSGPRGGLESFQEYRDSLQDVFHFWNQSAEEIVFIGHSTGAAIILDYLRSGGQLRAAVLGAPLLKFRQWNLTKPMLQLFRNRTLHVAASRAPSCANEEFHRRKLSDPLRVDFVSNTWPYAIQQWFYEITCSQNGSYEDFPMLILQGQRDSVVHWEENLPIIEDWYPQAQVFLYPELMHHIFNERPKEWVYYELDRFLSAVVTSPSAE